MLEPRLQCLEKQKLLTINYTTHVNIVGLGPMLLFKMVKDLANSFGLAQ
jgi:hypothetical protein